MGHCGMDLCADEECGCICDGCLIHARLIDMADDCREE